MLTSKGAHLATPHQINTIWVPSKKGVESQTYQGQALLLSFQRNEFIKFKCFGMSFLASIVKENLQGF
jgi:hypothetical protein